MSGVRIRDESKRDLIDHFVYLAENASEDIAERFLRNAEATFSNLAEHPSIGAPLVLRHPELASIRKWSVGDLRIS